MSKQQTQDLFDEPDSPEDALLHIARNTAKCAMQQELNSQHLKKIQKTLSSIHFIVSVMAVIMVSAVLFAFYTYERLESLAETARINQMLNSQ